jgi:hypothetical protein
MLKAIIDWIKHLFHVHSWVDEREIQLVQSRADDVPHGTRYIQKCSACGTRRAQQF